MNAIKQITFFKLIFLLGELPHIFVHAAMFTTQNLIFQMWLCKFEEIEF